MNKNRILIYSILAVFIIIFGFSESYFKPKSATAIEKTNENGIPSQIKVKSDPIYTIQSSMTEKKLEEKIISTHNGSIVLTNEFVFLKNWVLSHYGKTKGSEEKVDLNYISRSDHELGFLFDSPDFLYLKDVHGDIRKISDNEYLWFYEDDKIQLTKNIKINSGTSTLNFNISGEFKSQKAQHAFLSIKGKNNVKDTEAQFRSFVYFTEGAKQSYLMKDLSFGSFHENRGQDFQFISTPVKWLGLKSRYFLFAILPEQNSLTSAQIQPLGELEGRISYLFPLKENKFNFDFRLFFGPKELALLRSVDPTMDTAVDLGWFSFIGYFLLRAMNWLYLFVHNYGFAIIILTVLLKILTYPLTYKSMKSMKEMSKLQPEITKIREKFKDNKEKLNQEMMALMKNKGYNPVAGCLPILIQMPVFIALYNVLLTSVELYQAPFALWIMDLSEKDPYFITPIVLSILMWFQQIISPSTATDPMQKRMMQFMPLIFGLFMLYLPSGLTLYMLANVVSGIIQQFILNKKLGLKNVSLPVATVTK